MKRTVRVYIAGPYTKPDPAVNTRVAMLVWNKLWKLGYIPTVPHWSMFQHFLLPMPYEEWLEYDFLVIERQHAILRIPGESSGADREEELAAELGIPVYRSIGELLREMPA